MPSATGLLDLPPDVCHKLIDLLSQRDQAALLVTCKSMYDAVFPHIYRMFRCCNCTAELFPPCELQAVRDERPRRVFLELRQRAPTAAMAALTTKEREPCATHDHNVAFGNKELQELGLSVDSRTGAANFHVLQHLARTLYAGVRFPFPEETRTVHTLRCAACGVFCGFRKDGRAFVHSGFLELVDVNGRARTLKGTALRARDAVRCVGCDNALFDVADIMQWTHVLASHRLTDFDAYLEWDHSWGGEPAFFVKRLRRGSYTVAHVRVERCRQGDMEVGDVACAKCKRHIGWKFLAECSGEDKPLRNYDQVGRFGIVRSSLTPSEPRSSWG